MRQARTPAGAGDHEAMEDPPMREQETTKGVGVSAECLFRHTKDRHLAASRLNGGTALPGRKCGRKREDAEAWCQKLWKAVLLWDSDVTQGGVPEGKDQNCSAWRPAHCGGR